MVHRFNIFLLSILLVVAQIVTMNQALAAGLDGWTLSNPIAQGASTLYNGAKQVLINGKNVAKTSTALIKPTATQVAKVLARGAAGYALAEAVNQLLGAVDWVLDAENNQIKYWNTVQVFQSQASYNGIKKAQSQSEACQISIDYVKSNTSGGYSSVISGGITLTGKTLSCRILAYRASAPNAPLEFIHEWNLTEVKEDQPKTIPLPTVAQQVISNAESGNAAAQVATTAAAADVVNDAQNDSTKARPIVDQLETNANTETDANANNATGEAKPNTGTGATDLSIAFPAFCGWAPLVCEAAQSAISFPKKVQTWWDTAISSFSEAYAYAKTQVQAVRDYFKEEKPPEKETTVEIDQTIPVVPNTSYFSWGAYCPFSPGSQTISIENTSAGIDYDLTSWCELASDIRPFVLAVGALMSFLIAAGVVMGRDD